jgi:protein N-terminal amidase
MPIDQLTRELGYNHPSLASIAPYLEPTAAGPSTRWATRTAVRLKCTVCVGYPEAAEEGNYNTAFDEKITAHEDAIAYNSLVIVDATGEVVGHYRKSFLYYTDETWAKEGQGFFAGVLPMGSHGARVKAVAGICMDINPYKFEAPWNKFEFANHARESRASLVVVSMVCSLLPLSSAVPCRLMAC